MNKANKVFAWVVDFIGFMGLVSIMIFLVLYFIYICIT